jgi:hypothetical protein
VPRRLGSIKLETPFKDMILDAVLLFLRCCYQFHAVKEHLDAALADPAGCAAVQELLRLAHMLEAPLLLKCCIDHLLSRVSTVQGSLMGWLSAAEECHATSLLPAFKHCVVARLQEEATFRATAADFLAGIHKLDHETAVSILAGIAIQLKPRLVEVDVSGTQGPCYCSSRSIAVSANAASQLWHHSAVLDWKCPCQELELAS